MMGISETVVLTLFLENSPPFNLTIAVLTVQFEPFMYDVVEGEAVSLRLVLNRAASRDVTAVVSTSDASATGVY